MWWWWAQVWGDTPGWCKHDHYPRWGTTWWPGPGQLTSYHPVYIYSHNTHPVTSHSPYFTPREWWYLPGCFPPFKTLESLNHQIESLMQNADRSKIPSSLVLIRHILTPGCKYFPFSQNIYLPNQAIHLDDVDIDCVFSNNCSVCRVSRGDDNIQDNWISSSLFW